MFDRKALIPPERVGFVELIQWVPSPVILNGVAIPIGKDEGLTFIDGISDSRAHLIR